MPNSRTEAASHSLLPSVIDLVARDEPDSLWGEYPKSTTTLADGYEKLSYKQFANAVNGIAHQIEKTLGRRDTGEPLAYLAANDPRCAIALVAAIKAGFHIFLISERNSVAANLKLLDDVNCTTLLTTDRHFVPVQTLLTERTVTLVELLPLQQLLHEDQPDFSFTKRLSGMEKETAFMVHTSGSTGFPKPMPISHEYISRAAQNIGLDAPEGYEMLNTMTGNNRNVLLLPLGHPAGVHFGVLNPFFNNTTVILPLPGVPPTGEMLLEMLKHTDGDWATMAPLTLETISKNITLLDEIAPRLQMLLFSGGSLPKVFGDVIATKIRLTSLLGSSESGPLPTIYRHGYDFERDWNYLQIHPAVGAKFDQVSADVFELVFHRSPKSEPHQTVFTLYPDLQMYRTKDLFTPHPTLPDTWTHASRSDDVIVFLNGEKVNPIVFESNISKHPEVAAALMFGQQRFEAGLLIEPANSNNAISAIERARLIQQIWPAIEQANRLLPGYAQVSQSHICFTDPGSPILRTLKGSIRRPATLELYAAKINQLYTDVEAIWTPVNNRMEVGITEDSLQKLVKHQVLDITSLSDINQNENFFNRGMDSLQVLRLVRVLRMKTSLREIQPSTIYLHPTVELLARALHEMAHHTSGPKNGKNKDLLNTRFEILEKHIGKIDEIQVAESRSLTKADKEVVLLTGSTGTIGSYILRALLQDIRVKHIYCLNRSPDSATLQLERNKSLDASLPSVFPEDKITFLTAELSEPTSLDLPADIYKNLCEQVTTVIHNAWRVDFNIPLQSFDSQLAGVVNLVALCARSSHQAVFTFLSSISAVMDFDTTNSANKTVPETIITDITVAAAAGYAESKYIAERLLAHATEKLGLRETVILRLGQIAGASRSEGRWNLRDWVPALVLGSRALNALPSSLDSDDADDTPIDWLPIDTLADVVVEIAVESAVASSDSRNRVNVLHLLNPHRTSWKTLLPSIAGALEEATPSQGTIDVVSPKEWITRLRANATTLLESSKTSNKDTGDLIQANPALRLIDFFDTLFGQSERSRLRWETAKAEEVSAKLRSTEAIDGDMMARWVKQWCASTKA